MHVQKKLYLHAENFINISLLILILPVLFLVWGTWKPDAAGRIDFLAVTQLRKKEKCFAENDEELAFQSLK